MNVVNQNIAATDGSNGSNEGRRSPDAPNGGGTVDALLSTLGNFRDLAGDVRYSRHEPFVLAATARAIAKRGRSVARAPNVDPAFIAAALDAEAEAAGKDAVWCSSDKRAIAQAQRAATYRRLAAVLREPGFGEGRA
ncbi:hypothetical protein ACLBX9_29775 [Methylobacterium sp. A49B]